MNDTCSDIPVQLHTFKHGDKVTIKGRHGKGKHIIHGRVLCSRGYAVKIVVKLQHGVGNNFGIAFVSISKLIRGWITEEDISGTRYERIN